MFLISFPLDSSLLSILSTSHKGNKPKRLIEEETFKHIFFLLEEKKYKAQEEQRISQFIACFFADAVKCKFFQAGIGFSITLEMNACFWYGMSDATLNYNNWLIGYFVNDFFILA